jgi:hypothetical protein
MENILLSGKEFKEKYGDKVLIKLTNKDENHNWFQFKTGLNIDTIRFNPTESCKAGGIYFSEVCFLPLWLEYNKIKTMWCRKVTIPHDAQVYVEEFKFKADKIILAEKVLIGELNIWRNEKYCMEALNIKYHWSDINYPQIQYLKNILKYIPETVTWYEKICLEIVKVNNKMIYNLASGGTCCNKILPTENNTSIKNDVLTEIYLEAIKGDFTLFNNLPIFNKNIINKAVTNNGLVLSLLDNQKFTSEFGMSSLEINDLCMSAVKNNGMSLNYVKEKTNDICLAAVKQNGLSLEFVDVSTPELCLKAVKQNGLSLKFVKNQNKTICLEAVKQNGLAINDITYTKLYDAHKENETSRNILFEAIKNYATTVCQNHLLTDDFMTEIVDDNIKKITFQIEKLNNIDLDIIEAAVTQNGLALQYIAEKTNELCWKAIKQNPYALICIINHKFQNGTGLSASETEEMCLYALENCNQSLVTTIFMAIRNQTEKICLLGSQRGIMLNFLQITNKEILLNVVKHDPYNVAYIYDFKYPYLSRDDFNDLHIEAVKKNGNILLSIKDEYRTQEVCNLAVKNSPTAILYVPSNLQTFEMCLNLLRNREGDYYLIKDRKLAERALEHLKNERRKIQPKTKFVDKIKKWFS